MRTAQSCPIGAERTAKLHSRKAPGGFGLPDAPCSRPQYPGPRLSSPGPPAIARIGRVSNGLLERGTSRRQGKLIEFRTAGGTEHAITSSDTSRAAIWQ